MKRFLCYSFFFFISGLIHLFLCVDLLHLKSYVPQWDASHFLEKVKTLKSKLISTSERETPLSFENPEKSNVEKNLSQEESISELLQTPDLFPTQTSAQEPTKINALSTKEEVVATELLSLVVFGKAEISSTNFLEVAKNNAFQEAIEKALEQLHFSPPYPKKLFQDPFLYIQNYSVLEIEEQPEFCLVKMRVLLHAPSLREAFSRLNEISKSVVSAENTNSTAELAPSLSSKKINTSEEYQNHLLTWIKNVTPPETYPALRLVSESTLLDLYRREQTQSYRIICFPQQNPQYFVTIHIGEQGQVSYEKRQDTYSLQNQYSRRYLRENIPLFQRFKAEIGSNTALYHPKDGPLLIVHLIPKERENYLLFKQHILAKQCGLKLEDIQVIVGSFKETSFGEDVLILSGILTKSGEKYYPKDPELELLEFR